MILTRGQRDRKPIASQIHIVLLLLWLCIFLHLCFSNAKWLIHCHATMAFILLVKVHTDKKKTCTKETVKELLLSLVRCVSCGHQRQQFAVES